jgi:hypothetical protein
VKRDLIYCEAPRLAVLGKHKVLGIKGGYLDANVGEGFETEAVFHEEGVSLTLFDGDTLNEDTVTYMLEVAEYLRALVVAEQRYLAGEVQELAVGVCHAPLAPQVTSIASLLAGGKQKDKETKE